ncbi:hypothetical protein [Weissella confusa]|uniref:hypothetical protein n=1 Tax=Weissella confusa TaxID=1583 RepID=UPI00223B0679|nr:hypothetical protein [Weissella confusa]MCT0013865.1 hypothetical protein [Weissella confusa]
MTKYVIDLPDAAKVIVAKKRFLLNETDLMRIPVSQLELYVEPTVAENATVEKRVIELPADVIAELKTIKEDNGDDNLQGFMNDVNDDEELWQDVEGFNRSGMTTDALLGEWWLEHVEFVPKDEARYKVLITGYSINGNQFVNMDSDDRDILIINEGIAITYSKSEADKVIERLGGENGFLQLRKVKVEE